MAMEGSLRGNLQRVSLMWKKEVDTLERTINYFAQSGEKVELPWDSTKMVYEGTAELVLGQQSGSLFISDQPIKGPLFQVCPFEVDRKSLGVVQEILLVIEDNPVSSLPQPISTPAPEISSPHSGVMTSSSLGLKRIEPVAVADVDEVEVEIVSSLGLAKKEKDRLEGEKRVLMEECARVREEKQALKQESFEIDEQLISAMEQLTAYERQQSLMEERHNALLREARLLEEENASLKVLINEKDVKSAADCETIRQLKIDVQDNIATFEHMRQEKERLVARCNDFEQQCARSEMEVFKVEEMEQASENIGKELNVFRSDCEQLRDKYIPSLLQDIDELKQQNQNISERYQKELQLTKQERNHLEKEWHMVRGHLKPEEKKKIDASEDDSRDSMKLIDQLSRHFEECSQALKKLVQLLEANVDAKDNQLDRRSRELREARNRNDSLVQEVVSRGQKIEKLAEKLRNVSASEAVTSSGKAPDIDEQISEAVTNVPNDSTPFPSEIPPESNSHDHAPTLPCPSNLITYQPVIKMMYRDLPNVTNKVIDFNNTPIQVIKMNYLENPKSHIGYQVICMLRGNYTIGLLKTVFQFRPIMSGLIGSLLPITYAGIQFDEPVGECDGTFKGETYFECPRNHAEFISIENVFIRV